MEFIVGMLAFIVVLMAGFMVVGVIRGGGRLRDYRFRVRCTRCGEIIEGRVNLSGDASRDEQAGKPIYFCRKVLMGGGRCYQQLEVTLRFDQNGKVLERQVTCGEFVE